jgi:hypothetical protein
MSITIIVANIIVQFIITWLPYQEGDENVSLDSSD